MRTVTPGFRTAMRASHAIDAKVDLYFPGVTDPVTVQPVSGSITVDRNAQIRRTGSVVIPWALDANLAIDVRTLPLGGYAVPYRGIRYPDGSSEMVKLGHMRVEAVTWSTLEELATIELADRMAQVRDEPFQTPYVASGLRVANAAKAIVLSVFPSIATDIRFDPAITLVDVIYSGTRIDALFELARSVGAETYFDADGNWVFDIAAGGRVVKRNGTLTDNSAVITGLSATSDLQVGMTVIGIGIPQARRIASINSSSQVTLNAPANTLGTKNGRLDPGSTVVTDVTDTDDLSLGMTVTGTGIPAATTIVALAPATVTLSKAATSGGYPLLTFTAPSPAALTFAGGAQAYPAWDIDAGEAGTLVDAGESLSRSGVYNGVLIGGQATAVTAVFSVLVVDSASGSITLWGGPFGKVLRVESSNAIQNATQAQIVAETMLNDGLGLARSLTILSAPMPALEAGDTIRVTFGDGREENHLIDVVTHDVGPAQMSVATRAIDHPSDVLAVEVPRRMYQGADVWRELRDMHVIERIREPAERREVVPA